MTRRNRCEFQGAIYLVTLTGHSGRHVLYDPQIFKQFPENPRSHAPDAGHFESLLWHTSEQYDGRVHAYLIEPNAAQIIIQTHGAPLCWIMHDLLARYSTYLAGQGRMPTGERPFPGRYKAQIVQPAKLPYAVRCVHRGKSAADTRRRSINHPFSSNMMYCGRKPLPDCFAVMETREALELLGHVGPGAYFEFMGRSDSPAIAHMLSRHVIGEEAFVRSVREQSQIARSVLRPDDLLREVTVGLLDTDPRVASSSTHRGALARALVAWYAMRTGVAQIGTVSRWFGVTSSDLRYLIRRHRQLNPQHFSKPLSDLFPALFLSDATAQVAQSRDDEVPRATVIKA
ncbi:MAG TPA: hypothetical protein VGR92_18105 [Steroidobacteraceae bacterium]|nr:hypothetical protein [Steroidobacteraceae bacterium]